MIPLSIEQYFLAIYCVSSVYFSTIRLRIIGVDAIFSLRSPRNKELGFRALQLLVNEAGSNVASNRWVIWQAAGYKELEGWRIWFNQRQRNENCCKWIIHLKKKTYSCDNWVNFKKMFCGKLWMLFLSKLLQERNNTNFSSNWVSKASVYTYSISFTD